MSDRDWMVRGSIWIALAAFVAAEGLRPSRASQVARGQWAAGLFLFGAMACTAHVVATMYVHHGWDYARAWQFTAEQTQSVYGVSWGGGLWINFLFLGAWAAEAEWWMRHPQQVFAAVSRARWALRAFYALIIVNGAVIFTSGPARVAGVLLTALLLWFWLRRILQR